MEQRTPRWPTREEREEAIRNHVLLDFEDEVPPYGLEEWEIKGEPPPEASQQQADDGEGQQKAS